MEVVFVSSDEGEEAMRSYMKGAHADWLTGLILAAAFNSCTHALTASGNRDAGVQTAGVHFLPALE